VGGVIHPYGEKTKRLMDDAMVVDKLGGIAEKQR